MRRNLIKAAILCMIAGLSLSGCKKDDGGDENGNGKVAVAGVSLSTSDTAITVGETFAMTATVVPDNATNKTLTWTSSNTAIATVSEGTVTALALGETVITVSTADGNKTASCTVTVEQSRITMKLVITDSRDYLTFHIAGSETATMNWGDGATQTIAVTESFKSIQHTYVDASGSRTVTITGPNITGFKCSGYGLTALDVSKYPALTWLECNNNQLTTLDVSRHTALTGLECYNNQLSALDVSKNTALTILYCNSNQLSTAALNTLFGTLHSNTIPGTWKDIYIAGNPGTNSCNRSIATNKGWTVRDSAY